MTDTIHVVPDNELHIKIQCDAGIGYELQEYFTFSVPGAKFMPAVRNKMWDGKIRLYNVATQRLYKGLIPYVKRFGESREYDVEVHEELTTAEEFSLHEAEEFAKQLSIDPYPRDYQLKAFVHAIRYNRGLLLSPTASGKSLIIYLLTQWHLETKVLLIVPTVSLVYQMKGDFLDYAKHYNEFTEDNIRVISGTEQKDWKDYIDQDVTITTWQSIHKMPKAWFQQFGTVIGDEAHLFKAKSLTSIMTRLDQCKYRYGFTGTLDGTQTHKLVLEGLFGPVEKVTTTAELIEQEHLAEFRIKATVLKYPDEGTTEAAEREEIRAIVENEQNAIICASYGTFSTGVNIKNLHNIIFASPSKSRIRNLQSIGRGLRKGDNKTVATLYDVADDLTWKSHKNYTIQHFAERIKIYNEERFDYKIYTVKLKV